ncbi:hypothetical protein AKJ16_DCAP16463, partial [Drosera capensis]
MCPLRFILVFFSAVLAGYFAWRSLRSQSPEEDFSGDLISAGEAEKVNLEENDDEGKRSLKRIARDGFWVFVDMASGRYLWRNFKEMKTDEMDKKGKGREDDELIVT